MPQAGEGTGYARAAGLLGALLVLAGLALPGIPPAPDASVEAVEAFLRAQRAPLLAQAALLAVAAPLVVWFYAALRHGLAEADPRSGVLATAGFGGLLLLFATAAVGSVATTALAWRGPDAYDPGLVRFAYDLGALASFSLSAPFALLSVAAPSLAARRQGLLPDWLAAVAFVLALANVAELLGLFAVTGPIAGGATAGLVAMPAWALWVAGASVALGRSRAPAPARPR
jgi:hypothetical protein